MSPIRIPTPWLAALAIAATLLAGCAKKPPGCGDAETFQTIHSMVVNNVKASMPPPAGAAFLQADDPEKIQEGYFSTLKVEIVNVVSDGYIDQARKFTCRGSLTISTASGEKLSRDIVYSTQRTEDKDGGFLVEVQAFQPFVVAVNSDLAMYYYTKRLKGEWKGDYSCAGIDGAADGPQGPFTMPVVMVVDEKLEAKLERTTKGGGIEILSGRAGQKIELVGRGQNSPDDTWRAAFLGKVQGMEFQARGEIVTLDNRLLRQCTLQLKAPAS